MLELIFQGFLEWAYGLILECWQYFSTALLDIMSMDFAYLKNHVPVVDEIAQLLLAVGWALLIGNLVFQALKSMAVGLGFEGEDPKLLFTRTFVFAFLLLASPQICEIGLGMTSKIIDLLEIPDAVNITMVDESVFGSIGAAWLLVILFGLIVMFKVFKLLLEIAERYVILAMLTITAPLAFAMGGSKSTSEIFTGWCRMFGSMCLLMVTNVIFFKMLLSVLSTVPSGLDVLPWIVLILTIVKVARKADAIVTRIGLNPAITGDSLGKVFPGALTYMVVRTVASQITKTVGRSAGNGGRGTSPNAPPGGFGGPRTGGPSGGNGGAGGNSIYAQQTASQQSAMQQSASQNASSHTLAPQSTMQEQSIAAPTQSGMPVDPAVPQRAQERKTSVPLGTRRAPTHIKNTTQTPPVGARAALGRPGTAGKDGASVRFGTVGAAEQRIPSATGGVMPTAGGGDVSRALPEARYTRRPSKAVPSLTADAQPSVSRRSAAHSESSHTGTAGMPDGIPTQPPSGEPRPGRNGLPSRTAASSDARQHSPVRQESRGASATATIKGGVTADSGTKPSRKQRGNRHE